MDFDKPIDRRDHYAEKWTDMEKLYGVSSDDGLAMWVADTDFRAPDCVQSALQRMIDHGVYGYPDLAHEDSYRRAICWWMENRHGWQVDPAAIYTATGLGNAVGMIIQSMTEKGDGVVLFTPVYHSFARIARTNGRKVVECPLVKQDGRYKMDFDAYEQQLDGSEKLVIFCSPHNPGGTIWTVEEQRELVDFCRKHGLLLVVDEIHHDLVYPDNKHVALPVAAPDAQDIAIFISAASKTFNLAGGYIGQVIIHDKDLRAKFREQYMFNNMRSNSFGTTMTRAAYSAEGAEWVDAQMAYLDGNRQLFEDGIGDIPGVSVQKLQATYLSWVDFSGTGMTSDEIKQRILGQARIAPSIGETFGAGGEDHMRFNLGTQRANIAEAVARLQDAFSDLQ